MPLIELKTYRPVCDWCGKEGSTFRERKSSDDVELPRGWIRMQLPTNPLYPGMAELLCEECIDSVSPPDDASRAQEGK